MSGPALIPRISLTWLLAAQALVIIPHLLHVPTWLIPLWLVCGGWRIQIFRQRADYPRGWVKALLLVGVTAGVLLSHGTVVGLDAGVTLLLATFVLKLLEMKRQRDAQVLIYMGFFVVVTAYLFEDSLLSFAYSLLPISCLTAALIGLQQSRFNQRPWATWRLAAGLLLQALPLMLLLFVFFPRIGPLWSMPTPDVARTGLAESMSPADVAELSRSSELAFRATFDGPIPAKERLYWRALTLDDFDGRRWSQSSINRRANVFEPPWQKQGEVLDYQILMQPTGQPWLFALDVAEPAADVGRLQVDFRVQSAVPVEQAQLYRLQSWPEAVRQPQLPDVLRRLNLRLPSGFDPRTRAWAAELRQQYPDDQALVLALLQHFNREPFHYTLRPPVLGQHSNDEFLFATRRGFCAHYAGAMVVVLRAAGIPARVVAGYQGGEVNQTGNYLLVHQFDAHAWVEYWRPGKGWQSVDPTFEVAPERIEFGLEEALADEGSFLEGDLLAGARLRNIPLLNQLRLAWDELNYNWQRWVLGYQGEQQLRWLQSWLGTVDWQRLGLTLVAAVALLLMVLATWLLKPWQARPPAQQRYLQQVERLLAHLGVQRQTGEGARRFSQRAQVAIPAQAAVIKAFFQEYERQVFAGEQVDELALRAACQRLRRALPWWQRWR
ncbi:transglutaminase TgpA family protein [Atopomonas sediminilitoris]|uniref:transglutaminase TgpA family protein n=1 Tax=Atopomonas sediminilitoris TaxID=2919919 RepID=UPI001F4EC18F|nr:DUF3488 and transglutaminase-like domain-containing protein [Atopomonas sediminilitoris]MCJ8169227.1 DUF3488 and transglutaminase-like domain-containing protein [Atopomonas sediminilitoris]